MAKAQKTESDLNISLESHLVDALRPLPKLLPAELCDRLLPYLDAPKTAAPATDAPRRTIPYALLDAISKWSRTTAGLDALTAQTPKLDPRSYTMIALLAGTTTSPERKFPAYVPQEDLDAQARQRTKDDKRALTTLLNALLSIGGCGFATWWAADRLHWRNEWRVLLALFASTVVAIAEAGLYIIWDSRRSTERARRARRSEALANRREKQDSLAKSSGPIVTLPDDDETQPSGLRQRVIPAVGADEDQ